MIREINENDFEGLSRLYTHLHSNPPIPENDETKRLWEQILNDKSHHIIICEIDNKIVSSCVCVIIPNLTHNQQPYAVIENVVTDKKYRKKGYATQCLDYAKEIAKKENCYKMMLMTGSRKRSTHRFYQKAGYNKIEKTAYIQRI